MAKNTTAPEVEENINPMVTVYLPPATGEEEDHGVYGLNGKLYRIKKGEPVRVPKAVADLIDESEYQKKRQRAFILEQERKARESSVRIWG